MIGNENQFLVFLREAVLDRFYCTTYVAVGEQTGLNPDGWFSYSMAPAVSYSGGLYSMQLTCKYLIANTNMSLNMADHFNLQ